MKKILSMIMAFCMLALNVLPASAMVNQSDAILRDVTPDYWAYKAINDVVTNNVMTLDENGRFNPEKSMTRVDFVQSLLRVLSNENLNVRIQNVFSDVKETYPAYLDILRSEQLGLVYGYPDGTFKPERKMKKSEVTSIMSHITKDADCDEAILNEFTDSKNIPAWDRQAYAKTTKYGLYVNYPDAKVFLPNKNLSRAEAAVLLSNLRERLGLVKEKYKGVPEKLISTEHLNSGLKINAPVNLVKVTNLRKVILSNNLLAVCFETKFTSKTAKQGDMVNFVIPQNLYTKEGTLVLPANTKLSAEIINLQKPKMFNKNARVGLKFRTITLPNGQVIQTSGHPYTKDGMLKEGPWNTAGKLALSTISGGLIGGGAGVGFAFIPTPDKIGTGIAIGTPVGCGIGLITGLVTKGLNYNAKAGEQIVILVETNTSIYDAPQPEQQPEDE